MSLAKKRRVTIDNRSDSLLTAEERQMLNEVCRSNATPFVGRCVWDWLNLDVRYVLSALRNRVASAGKVSRSLHW